MEIKSSKKIILLPLLQELSPESSKNTLRGWIEKGRITVDGMPAKTASQVVEEGQVVALGRKQKFLPAGLKIVYEDEQIVVIDKPEGLLSVDTENECEHSVHGILKKRYNTGCVYPVHRLDRDTSGLLVFAYTTKARDSLKGQLLRRTMGREYLALVHGEPGRGTWKNHLRENVRLFVEEAPAHVGKLAITHYETIKKRGSHTLIRLKLETGRKHQIRVQAALAGCPIVGDPKYGKKEGGRLYLHATRLHLSHPITQKPMSWNSPVYW